MSVHQKKDGRWIVVFSDENGKRNEKYFGRSDEAEYNARSWDAEFKLQKRTRKAGLPPIDYKAPVIGLLRLKFISGRIDTPDLIDSIMSELDIPLSFDQIRKYIADTNVTRRKGIPASLRFQILERDNNSCRKCGAAAPDAKLHVDHIKPVSRGGLTEKNNLQTLCDLCNMGKSNHIFSEHKGHFVSEEQGGSHLNNLGAFGSDGGELADGEG